MLGSVGSPEICSKFPILWCMMCIVHNLLTSYMAVFLKKMIEKAFSILFVDYAKETMSVFNGHPTRSTALLQFNSTVSVFFNQEMYWDSSLTDLSNPNHI